MINITIYKTKEHGYKGFDVEGHAGFDETGNDIVCAAVSILVINTIKSIERLTNDKVNLVEDEKEGVVRLRFTDKASDDASILIDSMVYGLQDIEDDETNSNINSYIDITFEEV